MKVFVTGASGFVGSAIVENLISRGHEVLGLARSEASAESILKAGGKVIRGTIEDPDILQQAASECDGVIHTAFNHEIFAQDYAKAAGQDKAAIEAMGEVLKGTHKPLITTGGTIGQPLVNGWITEESKTPEDSSRQSEPTTIKLAEQGVNASVVRLSPSVHGTSGIGFRAGFGLYLVQIAKEKGYAAYVGEGSARWPAVHRLDVAELFCLALEKKAKGARYNAVGNEPLVSVREMAEFIGKHLNLSVKSITPEESAAYFGFLNYFVSKDSPAKSEQTQKELGWNPNQIGLLEDLQENYF